MNLLAAAIALFLILLLLPIGLATFWYFKNKNARDSVLPVRQERTRDPRYFAHAYEDLFAKAWQTSDGNTLTLNKRPEVFINADLMDPKEYTQECEYLVVAEKKNFCPPANMAFQKEIYAKTNAFISGNTVLRAIHSEKNLDLANDTTVVRWADAEGTVTVGNDCDLGMSLTSGTKIVLGKNCVFRRLYAPLIQVGIETNPSKDLHLYPQALDTGVEHFHKRHVKEDHMDEDGMLHKSVISRGKLWVDDNLKIQGSLHAERGVRIGCNALICGNIFSSGDVYLRKNCRVLGNVFAQGDIYCESDVQIGMPGEIRSVVARQHITLEKGCRVYGYLSNEDSGFCAPTGRKQRDEETSVGYARHEVLGHEVRRRSTGLAMIAIGFAAVFVITVMATLLSNRIQDLQPQQLPVSEEELYRNQGLEPGAVLDPAPELITDTQVEFEDRILLRCNWTDEQVKALQTSLNEFLRIMRRNYPDVNLYSMVVPLRIGFENSAGLVEEYAEISEAEREKLVELERSMMASTPSYCTYLPVVDVLSMHQDEYLFFRGSPTWTVRGAYYGSQVFLNAAGLEIFPIESFYETARTKGSGILKTQSGEDFSDRRYVYLFEDYNPMVKDIDSGEKAPMFSSIRNSYSAFMGGHYKVGVMDGMAKNGRVLLLMGNKNAQPLAPWMVTQFQQIIYMNMDVYSVSKGDFWEIFRQFDITDCLVVHDADTIPKERFTDKYQRIAALS